VVEVAGERCGGGGRRGTRLLGQGNELPPEHRRVPVLAVVGQLRDVEYLDVYAFWLQRFEMRLGPRQAVVRSRRFVTGFVDGLCFVEALAAVFSTPVASPEKSHTHITASILGNAS
jgi:hypothetical protein